MQLKTPSIRKKKKKKTDCDAKILDIKSKYFSTSDYSKFRRDILDARLKRKRLVDKSVIVGFTNKADLNKKVETLVTKQS